jgi:lipoprotein signal peptidase
VLLFLIVTAVLVVDRLMKTLALTWPLTAAPLVGGLLVFEPGVNTLGPLGIFVPRAVFFILAGGLSAALFILLWAEQKTQSRVLLWGVILGIASNSYDRLRFGHIIDTLRLAGGLSFNLADVLIVGGVMTIIAQVFYLYFRGH